MRRVQYLLSVIALVLLPTFASAHAFDFAVIHSEMRVGGQKVYFESKVGQAIVPTEETGRFAFIQKFVEESLLLRNGQYACQFTLDSFDANQEINTTKINGVFDCGTPIDVGSLVVQSNIYRSVFEDFEHHMIFSVGDEKHHMLFDQDMTLVTKIIDPVREKNYIYDAVLPFFGIGIEHIVFGFDHVLFLCIAVLLMRKFRHILGAVTVFTIAHSTTLILSMFGILQIYPSIIEPVIALTIIFSAVLNLFYIRYTREPKHAHELAIAFVFGLVHGLGFAASMHGIMLPEDFIGYAIVLFNLGIEVGQLAILLLFVPILWVVRKTKYSTQILGAVSAAGFVVALYWFFDRVL